jgi:5-methyltetrahydrofolate--homocysteine methyltransferase
MSLEMTAAEECERSMFVYIGERTNVSESARFKQVIARGDYDTALRIAREQIDGGAQIIDVNVDDGDGSIDSERAMSTLLGLIAADPDIGRVPVMIDSSRWNVIEAGLKRIQGKAIVNAIGLEGGDGGLLEIARKIHRYGAAVVVAARDEQGRAQTVDHKVSICERAYDLLTQQARFDPEDIIFDPVVLPVATDNHEHNDHAVAFIEAVWQTKERLPGARISGNIPSASLHFRGNDPLDQAIHAVLLHHARAAGLDMAIVNTAMLRPYEELNPRLRERVEDVILNRRPDATARLLEIAASR